ncbi:MAG: RNA polymerase sigma factor [Chloroflexi bacterium]|nr:RNA polymerase sigma factor [Chloroflexota bacterium]
MLPARRASLDAEAFAEAVRPPVPRLRRLASRLGPPGGQDDVVQEALVRAWRHRASFAAGRGTFIAWLLSIVANEAHRATSRQRHPVTVAPARSPASLDDRLDIAAAIERLTPRQRLAVDCFYFADLSIAETAVVMDCSEGTVKSTLADARAQLRRRLEGQGQ